MATVKLTDVIHKGDFPARIWRGICNQLYWTVPTYEQVLLIPLEQWYRLPNLGAKSLADLDRIIEEKTGHRLSRHQSEIQRDQMARLSQHPSWDEYGPRQAVNL